MLLPIVPPATAPAAAPISAPSAPWPPLLLPMMAPAIAPNAAPPTAPCWVLGPLSTPPENKPAGEGAMGGRKQMDGFIMRLDGWEVMIVPSKLRRVAAYTGHAGG